MHQVIKDWSLREKKKSEPNDCPKLLQVKSSQATLQKREPSQGWAFSLEREGRAWNCKKAKAAQICRANREKKMAHKVLEICRQFPLSFQMNTHQHMHVKKLPKAWERNAWKYKAELDINDRMLSLFILKSKYFLKLLFISEPLHL